MNRITINAQNCGTFEGALAQPYIYIPELRGAIDRLYTADKGRNRFFVLDGPVTIAAQSTESGAMGYMNSNTVLVEFESIPMEYRVNVQCTDENTGETADFITKAGEHKAISPLFNSLAELFPWMGKNGWRMAEYSSEYGFVPWRCERF